MNLTNKKILVVDDEKDIIEIIATELLALGAIPIIAHNVSAALKCIESNDIALVISDIRMPGSSGVELLDSIRKARVDLPVILVTGFADLSVAEALARGAEAMLYKPFELDTLFELVERLVKPLTERWHRAVTAETETKVKDECLSYGRGGFFVPSPLQPKIGSLFKLLIDRGDKSPKVFEVICRWGRHKRKSGPDGWGAEIRGWEEATAKEGWSHSQEISFIPLE